MTTSKPGGTTPAPARRIHRLDETTVNRIAAGEIIHRPANALKELLENSLDAGSTAIQITVKDGGLKLMQIHDNGHGIAKDDLAIVCERFTTSKLRRVEDLDRIETFGFRGEALASISHVAHLGIVTRTADSPCAWRACYSEGRLVPAKPGGSPDPKPCAGNVGTQITVEDLFYNDPNRRRTLAPSAADEYARILDVVQRYAIHNPSVAFTCRKQGAHIPDLQTSSSAQSRSDTIRTVYGAAIARELLDIDFESARWGYHATALITNANYNTKKFIFLLFINNRLVDNSLIKKSIESLYAKHLPKHTHPFVYLNLTVPSDTLDVNVHPTKRIVQFLHEDAIVEHVCEVMGERLAKADESRVYFVQSKLTVGSHVPAFTVKPADGVVSGSASSKTKFGVKAAVAIAAASMQQEREQGGSAATAAEQQDEWELNSAITTKTPPLQDDATHQAASSSTGIFNPPSTDTISRQKMGTAMSVLGTRPAEHRLVRTDDRSRTLDAYIVPVSASTSARHGGADITGLGSQRSFAPVHGSVSFNGTSLTDVHAPNKRLRMDGDEPVGDIDSGLGPESLDKKVVGVIGAGNSDHHDMDTADFEPESLQRRVANLDQGCLFKKETDATHNQHNVDEGSGMGDNSKPPVSPSSTATAQTGTRIADRDYIDVQLTSILELRAELVESHHRALTELFREHTYVGIVTPHLSLIQHHTKLYLINHQDASRDLFYQTVIRGFSNLGTIRLSNPVSIHDLVMIALDAGDGVWDPTDMLPKPDIADTVTTTLVDRRDMLQEYFSIGVTTQGELTTLPVLLRGYVPNMDKLPELMLRLGGHVDWDEEKACFRTMAEEIALFYEVEAPWIGDDDGHGDVVEGPSGGDGGNDKIDPTPAQPETTTTTTPSAPSSSPSPTSSIHSSHPEMIEYRRQIEHLLFPALKRHLIATKPLLTERSVVQLADLPDLYKVFERC